MVDATERFMYAQSGVGGSVPQTPYDMWREVESFVEERVRQCSAGLPQLVVVLVDDARRARERFEWAPSEHPVPHCFSCGVGPDSMGVRAGPVDHPDDRHDRHDRDERDVPAAGGRYATDWAPPPWSVSADGAVDAGVLWAALDCTAAWYACGSDDRRVAVTVRYAVDVSRPLDPAGRYALVAWPGGGAPGGVGRKRSAASAAFAEDGTCVATAESLWVSVAG